MKMRSSAAEIGRRHAEDQSQHFVWITVCAALNFLGLQCWKLSDRKMKMRSSAAEIGRRHAADQNQHFCVVYSVCCLKFSWFTVLGTV